MGSFVSGLLSGGVSQAKKKQDDEKAQAQKKPAYVPGSIPSYKRGGKVRRTGLARVHKGERVLTKKQAKRYRRGRSKGR